jgi:hypothetical protein
MRFFRCSAQEQVIGLAVSEGKDFWTFTSYATSDPPILYMHVDELRARLQRVHPGLIMHEMPIPAIQMELEFIYNNLSVVDKNT